MVFNQCVIGNHIAFVRAKNFVYRRTTRIEKLDAVPAIVVDSPGATPAFEEHAKINIWTQNNAHVLASVDVFILTMSFVNAPVISRERHHAFKSTKFFENILWGKPQKG